MASLPGYIRQHLRMKPEVVQIFEDLEKYQEWVKLRMPPMEWDPNDLYNMESWRWRKYQKDLKYGY